MTEPKRYVILGSGIAGMAAAEAIRQKDTAARIKMISAEKELCFNRPMLIREFALDGSGAALFEQQQNWPDQFQVEVMLGTKAETIDRGRKCVRLQGAEGQPVNYDRLIYALGAEVAIPPIPGVDRDHVHVVRTREDMRRIREAMGKAKHAVVIGGGMLGLEDAWALREEKLEVTIIEQKQRVAFGQIDQSAGNLMKKRIERMGVPVYVNATVTEIGDGYITFRQPVQAVSVLQPEQDTSAPQSEQAVPASCDQECAGCAECPAVAVPEADLVTIPADLVILSTGVVPNGALGEAAGLKMSGGRWIAVDEYCRTSDPCIFAAGDAAAVNGRNDAIWDEAREMGRVAGTNAAACTRDEACAPVSAPSSEENGTGESSLAPASADPRPETDLQVYRHVVPEHVFVGFDTEIFTMADSSGAGTDGVYIRHADVEIFDYQRERYIRVSLQDGIIAGILLINAPELAPELMEAYQRGEGEEEARRIILRWKESHEVDFKPAAAFRRR